MDSLSISIFPKEARPYGLSYMEWTIKWWQWLASIPRPKNPAIDFTGENIQVGQNDPEVLFLCQTIEGVEPTPVRKGIIQRGKAVFMPVMNWISVMGVDGENAHDMIAVAKSKMDVVDDLEIRINGNNLKEELKACRIQAHLFDVLLPSDNIFDLPSGKRSCVGRWLLDILQAFAGKC